MLSSFNYEALVIVSLKKAKQSKFKHVTTTTKLTINKKIDKLNYIKIK